MSADKLIPGKPQWTSHLVTVMTSERFLKKQGLGNEVPFFICAYPAEHAADFLKCYKAVENQVRERGIEVLHIDLYDLAVSLLKDRGIFDRVIENEAEMDKDELKELLQSVLDPENHLIPAIGERMQSVSHQITCITGIGEVFPYIRSHNVLNNLQSTAKEYPTVMFFPGSYTHTSLKGSSLDLFDRLHDDRYYRAFNIMNYEV